jgi:TonB family protein
MLRSLVTLGRPAALGASVALHAAAIAAGGHSAAQALGRRPIGADVATVDIDVEQPNVVPALQDLPHPPVERAARASGSPHRHPYPVAPSHDARPHDPSIVHVPIAPPADEAAATGPNVVDAPADAPVRFVLPLGNATMTGTRATSGGAEEAAVSSGEASVTYDESQVSVSARLLASTPLEYPPEALTAQLESDVTLELIVDTNGRVVQAKSASEAGHGLDRAAIDAVRGYRFSPAIRRGRPVAVRMRWTVQFRLR